MVMIKGMAANLVNKPRIKNREQKNSANTTNASDNGSAHAHKIHEIILRMSLK